MIFFTEKVLAVVRRIPRGRVLSYKEVARRAGRPRAYRAVGNILNRCDSRKMSAGDRATFGGKVPCHRVIRSDGKIGGYRWGVRKKIKILREEKSI